MHQLKDIESLTYRQLQSAAKNRKIPANLKKSYLIKLILARLECDDVQIKKIIEDAYRERAHVKGTRTEKIVTRNRDVSYKRNRLMSSSRQHDTELEKLLKAPIPSKSRPSQTHQKNECFETIIDSESDDKEDEVIMIDSPGDQVDGNYFNDEESEKVTNEHFEVNNGTVTQLKCESVIQRNDEHDPLNTAGLHGLKRKFESSIVLPVNDTTSDSANNSVVMYDFYNNAINTSETGFNNGKRVREINFVDSFTDPMPPETLSSTSRKQMISMESATSQHMERRQKTVHQSGESFSNDNLIVINQNIQYFTTNITENRTILKNQFEVIPRNKTISQSVQSSLVQNIPFTNNRVNRLGNIDYAKYFKSNSKVGRGSNQVDIKGFKSKTQSGNKRNFLNIGNVNSKNDSTNHRSAGSTNRTINSSKTNSEETKRSCLKNQKVLTVDHHYGKFSNDNNKKRHCHKNDGADKTDEKQINKDIFNELMSLELRCDLNDEISTTVEEYFESLDILPGSEANRPVPDKIPVVSTEEEVYTSQTSGDVSTNTRFPETMVCFVCNTIGKVSNFENHVRRKHESSIFNTNSGTITFVLDMGVLRKSLPAGQQNCFIEHSGRLYVMHVEFKPPDFLVPILLSIPSDVRGTTDIQTVPITKFFLQMINYVKEEEFIWSGEIENLDDPTRPSDADVYSDRKHGYFEISMRALGLVPNNIASKDISKCIDSCSVEINLFMETLTDLR